jgi:hypothetical protein
MKDAAPPAIRLFCLFQHPHAVKGIPKQFMHQSPLWFDPNRLDSMVESFLPM